MTFMKDKRQGKLRYFLLVIKHWYDLANNRKIEFYFRLSHEKEGYGKVNKCKTCRDPDNICTTFDTPKTLPMLSTTSILTQTLPIALTLIGSKLV